MKWVVRGALILAVLGTGVYWAGSWMRPADSQPEFRTVQVVRGDLEETVQTTGVAEPQNRLEIRPPISGRTEEVLVREGEAVRKGQILAWMSSTERAALLDAARAQGPKELARWEELIRPTPLIAPVAGMIIARNVEAGQTVTSQDAVLVMSDRLIIKAQVDETDMARIAVGQEARVMLDAYPDRRIPGRVDHIGYEAKTVNNVTIYEVDILPLESHDFMRSGMTANVIFLVARRQNVLLLSSEAIQRSNGEATVRIPPPANATKPVIHPIQTGLTDGRQTEILSGLEEGDAVLVPKILLPSDNGETGRNPFSPFGRR